jgi:glycosyltransferase involved in cell wall biosynthesis
MQTPLSSPSFSNAEVLVSVPANPVGKAQPQSVSKQVEQNLDQLASNLELLQDNSTLELSIVMPCLNEADTVRACVRKAKQAIEKLGISGEVIVADNGSTDGSIEIALEEGARVVPVDRKGYGAALMGGIEAARGRFVLMGDADDSYDFTDTPKFYHKLLEGADIVQGCRLPSGGGTVMPGAMPWLHQWGNPALTWLVRTMFKSPVHDVYCGMRAFRRDWYLGLNQRCTGMEFATEMIIKSSVFPSKFMEVPITLHPDGRKAHRPHLRTFRDGWRTLRFFLMQSPRWLFLFPGIMLAIAGIMGYAVSLSGCRIAGVAFEAHTMLVATLSLLIAAQLGACAILARTFAGYEGLLPKDERLEKLNNTFTLERCLIGATILIIGGFSVIAGKAYLWAASGFGPLDYARSMMYLIPAAGAMALGVQAATCSFLLSLLRLGRR